MVPPMRKRPAGLAPLSLEAFKPGASSPRTPAKPGRPTRILLVTNSSSSNSEIPSSLSNGTISDVPIVGLVVSASSSDAASGLAPGFPSLIVPTLSSYELPPTSSSPSSSTLILPPLKSADDASKSLIDLLSSPSSADKTFEIRIEPSSTEGPSLTALQEAVEDALSKAYDREIKHKEERKEGGVKIVLDLLASPPPSSIGSSELARTEAFRNWSNFISRLSLHPRVLLKLSQPQSTSSNPSKTTTATTTDDVQSAAGESAAELQRRLRILLDVALEAFGDERLLFGFEQEEAQDGKTTKLGAQEWFEGVRGALSDMGLGEAEMNRVFADNAARVYGLKI